MKNKAMGIILILLVVICAGGIGVSIFLNLKTSNDLNTVTEHVNSVYDMARQTDGQIKVLKVNLDDAIKMVSEEEDTTENGVTIVGQYEIRDTTHISDAYKSGDTSGLSDEDKETLQMASDIIKKIIKDDMTPFEKEKAVYEWLCMYTEQSSDALANLTSDSSDQYTPHGVLKGRKAVCVGYATTFRLFMQMLDIPCMVVHTTEKVHTWDLVQLDGEWYHTDVYSDSGTANYRNFNVTDIARANAGNTWDRTFFPKADGTKYNYSVMMSKDLKNIYRLPKEVKELVDAKKGTKYFRFEKEDAEKYYNIVETMLFSCQSRVESGLYGELWVSWEWSAAKIDGRDVYVLTVFAQSNSFKPSGGEITDEQLQKIEEAVAKAFGE